jgi:hypothetical protein
MKHQLQFVWLFVLVFYYTDTYAQHFTITGNIADQSTGQPLEFVTVFIDKSTIGTTTNDKGFFKLSEITLGSKKLIVSSIGYKTFQTIVEADTTKNIHLAISLEPDNIALSEIKVTVQKDKQWDKDYKKFFKSFIGSSENAAQTVITNPYVIDFKHKNNTLSAEASQMLIVENNALGYKINVVLDTFFNTYRSASSVRSVFFQEMPAKDSIQHKKQIQKRKEAYQGSFRHFVNTLLSNSLNESGFSIRQYNALKNMPDNAITSTREIIARVKNSQLLFAFIFKGMIEITYTDPAQKMPVKTSWLKKKNEDPVVIDGYGNIFDSWFNLTILGYWGSQALADDVPEDFIRHHKE